MKDRLEDFIKNNRDQFDQKIPNLKVWSDIEKRLDPPQAKRIGLSRIIGIAASVIFLLGVGAFLGNYFTAVDEVEQLAENHQMPPEYHKQEIDLQKRINQKKAKLASYNYDASVNEDLMDLDETLNELRAELKNVPKGSEEQIVQAMIMNYETKIKILEIVLEKMDSNKSKKNKRNDNSEL